MMLLRHATLLDIPQMQVIRMAVKENILSDPNLITPQDYAEYLEDESKLNRPFLKPTEKKYSNIFNKKMQSIVMKNINDIMKKNIG